MGRKATKLVDVKEGTSIHDVYGGYVDETCVEWVNVYKTVKGYMILPNAQHDGYSEYHMGIINMYQRIYDKEPTQSRDFERAYFVDAKKGIEVIEYLGRLNNFTGENPLFNQGNGKQLKFQWYNYYGRNRGASFVGRKKNYLYDTLDEIKALGDFHPIVKWETIEKEGDEE